jgi:hypothetical protein
MKQFASILIVLFIVIGLVDPSAGFPPDTIMGHAYYMQK